jgi:hypothetical protein
MSSDYALGDPSWTELPLWQFQHSIPRSRGASTNPFATVIARSCLAGAIGVALITLGASLAIGQDATNPAEAEVDRLRGVWEGWSKSVHSMGASGFQFFGVCEEGTEPVSREDVLELVSKKVIPLVTDDFPTLEELRTMAQPPFPERKDKADPTKPHGAWRRYRFVQDGDLRRRDYEQFGDQFTVVTSSDGEQQYRSAMRLAELYLAPTGIRVATISDILYGSLLPQRTKAFTPEWKLEVLDGPRRQLRANAVDLEYDTESGFVYHHYVQLPPIQLFQERFQFLPVKSPQGISTPRIIVELVYRRSEGNPPPLSCFYIVVLDTFRLNPELAPKEFEIAVPAGTTVVWQAQPDIPVPLRKRFLPTRTTTVAVPNVKAFGMEAAFEPIKPDEPR